jgi:hypothetical protein
MKLKLTKEEAGELVVGLYEASNALRDAGRIMAGAPPVMAAMLLQDAIAAHDREEAEAPAPAPVKVKGKRGPDTKPRVRRKPEQTSVPGTEVPGPGQAVDGQGNIVPAEGGAK